MTVDVSTGMALDAVEDALGVGALVDDGSVIYDVERTICGARVAMGSPLGFTNVIAASVRVNTVWSMGSTRTAVSALTS